MADINYLAVLVAGVVAMILGGLWYGPLFGKLWMQGMGWDPNDQARMEVAKQAAKPAYVQMFILSLVQAYVLAHVVFMSDSVYGYGAVQTGLTSGFFMWLGFVLPLKYGDKLWGGKAFKYVAVDLLYYLVLLMGTGIVLSLWR